MMKKCKQCGTLLKSGETTCSNCGAPVPKMSNKTRATILVGAVVALVLLVVVALAVVKCSGCVVTGLSSCCRSSCVKP